MNRLRTAWEWVAATDRLVRLHFLIFSAVWPLMGAASVRPTLTIGEVVTLLAATLCFHSFAMVLNDVIDLPLDRTEPRRQRDPLVRGVIRPWQALLFALALPLLTIPLTIALGGGWPAQMTMAVGVVAMGVYDLWGKRCPFPPLTDALQGIGWGSLAIYAAQALGAQPNALTWLAGAYGFGFTLLFNGIHGPLRDLDNDLASGARTTAIFLGARPAGGTADPIVPRAVLVYAWSVLAALIAIHAAVVVRNDFDYGRLAWTITSIVAIGINVLLAALHPKALRPRGEIWQVAFRLQLYLFTIGLPLAFVAFAGAEFTIALLLLSALSLSLFESTPRVVLWMWLTIKSALPPLHKRAWLRRQA